MLADIMTKAIAAPQFVALRSKLGITVAGESSGKVNIIDALDNDSGVADSVENGFKTPRQGTAVCDEPVSQRRLAVTITHKRQSSRHDCTMAWVSNYAGATWEWVQTSTYVQMMMPFPWHHHRHTT